LTPDRTAFLAELGDIPVTLDRATVKRKSRDFYWYSPVLKPVLDRMSAEMVLNPRDEADMLRIAAASARHGVKLTLRGGGTGNYGQAVPLQGGAVVEMTALDQVLWIRDGAVRVQPGIRMLELDQALRAEGWELRMHPSTKRTATIGGFICGGSGGVGSVNWGGLRETGNLLGARVISAETEPQVIELRGADCNLINRTYGTTGLLTEIELPVQPAVAWRDMAVAFATFEAAAAFGYALARAQGVEKKLVSVVEPALAAYFRPLAGLAADRGDQGAAYALLMVSPAALTATGELAAAHDGRIVLETDAVAAETDPEQTPLYELTWNHSTLQVLKQDRGVTYTQTLYPPEHPLESVAAMRAAFGAEMMTHLEFIRFEGAMTCSGLPVIRYTTAERLNEIMAIHEAAGIFIANPHVVTLEDGSRHKRVPGDQLGFKRRVDPQGLLNPGKMRSFVVA
jgi:FAD/FMN-containing dehydrogenase